jgi:5,10-methylenetetrahydromethanopterin reductase
LPRTSHSSGPSISFDGREPVEAVLAKAQAAVDGGVESIWLACHLFQRDPIVTASVLMSRYPGLKITLVAISPYVVHPVHAAMAAATLDEFFPGRISLCLGVGAPADLANVGVETPAPLGPMRESLQICRALFMGETVEHKGKRFKSSGRALSSGRHDIPLLLAASGPKMLQLAGTHADGVLLSAGASVEFVRWSLTQVSTNPLPNNFQRHGLVYASVADDTKTAFDRVRRVLATTLRGEHHRHNLELAGSKLDQAAVNDAFNADNTDAADRLISDEIVEHHAAAGAPETFRSQIAAYQAAGLDNAVLASMRTPEQIATVLAALNAPV